MLIVENLMSSSSKQKDSGHCEKKRSRKSSPQDLVQASQHTTEEQTLQQATACTIMSSVEELKRELDEAYKDLDLAETKVEEDAEKIKQLEAEIDKLHKKSSELEAKVSEIEKVSADLDDESFDAAQEFQYKKQIEELQQQLAKRETLEKQLTDTKLELQEVRAQYEAVQFQQQRSTTRDKMKILSDEKSSKEEVQRLQKELRAVERKNKQLELSYEAKLKANQESIQRVQEKNKALVKKCDEMEKDRLQMKVEKTRLEKKLEKTGSYAEKKRFKTEQEAAEMELQNMKRKNAKLEKRLSMSTQMMDIIGRGSTLVLDGQGSIGSPVSEMSPTSSGMASPVPSMTLSEARILNLEKELHEMETKLGEISEENENLRDRAIIAERNVENLTKKLKEIDSELFHEKEANSSLEIEAEVLRQQATTPSMSIGDDNLLQKRVRELEKELEQNEIKFRVKEKDLWSTIEAQKRLLSDLEMEKIALEERLLDEEATDIEDDDTHTKPTANLSKRVEELEEQLYVTNQENEQLKAEVEKLKNEAKEIMESLEAELGDSTDGGQRDFLKEQNAELKMTLEEKTEQYVDTIREIARLKNIIEDQVRCYPCSGLLIIINSW